MKRIYFDAYKFQKFIQSYDPDTHGRISSHLQNEFKSCEFDGIINSEFTWSMNEKDYIIFVMKYS